MQTQQLQEDRQALARKENSGEIGLVDHPGYATAYGVILAEVLQVEVAFNVELYAARHEPCEANLAHVLVAFLRIQIVVGIHKSAKLVVETEIEA